MIGGSQFISRVFPPHPVEVAVQLPPAVLRVGSPPFDVSMSSFRIETTPSAMARSSLKNPQAAMTQSGSRSVAALQGL
jgi:hypothetical protein